jgi:hypothetical protein
LGFLSTFLLLNSLHSASLGSSTKNNSLIVYNGNIGLVHEKRALSVKKKDKFIRFEGVASSIVTDSKITPL